MSTRPALVVDGVTKIYGSGHTAVEALRDVSLELADGEFLALVGPSGSGKTTLLSIIGALLSSSAGSVTVGETEITALGRKAQTAFRAGEIGFVFQSFNLVPFLTARENLTIMGSIAGSKGAAVGEKADQLLGELGLSERRNNLPEQLSGGERQRVAIGRALMNDPRLVLVDEPTASLDTELGKQVVQLLAREIKDRGKAGIMVTHDMRMVEFTDRTIRILDGTLDGAADSVISS